MMDDRAAKLRRLNSFRRRLPHCSARALAAILKDIKANGMPEGGTSRQVLKDARNLQNATHTHHLARFCKLSVLLTRMMQSNS